jgi:hypothetical protein
MPGDPIPPGSRRHTPEESYVSSSEIVEIKGHILDAGTLSRVLDDVLELGTDYSIERFDVGHRPDDESYARIKVTAPDAEILGRLVMRLQVHGANLVDPGEAVVRVVEKDGVFPEDFYSTTNLDTQVRIDGQWVPVAHPEMDCGLLVSGGGPGEAGPTAISVRTVPVSDIKAGDRLVCGSRGVKVRIEPRNAARRERLRVHELGGVQREAAGLPGAPDRRPDARGQGRGAARSSGSAAPRSCTPAPRPRFCSLIAAGFVDVLFAGNALATHDIESSLFGTSLGVDLSKGSGVDHGHEHHIRAINRIRGGGIDRGRRRAGRPDLRGDARHGDGTRRSSCWSARYATTGRCPTSTPT